MFRKFHIDLSSETSVVKVFEPFDRDVLHRMKLHDFPQPPPQPPQSSTQAPSSSTQPPFTEPIHLNHLLHLSMLSTTLFLLR